MNRLCWWGLALGVIFGLLTQGIGGAAAALGFVLGVFVMLVIVDRSH